MRNILQFMTMGGYAIYVWPAYGIVLGVLILQLFIPWRRCKKIREQNNTDE